uniref:Uncharacterized protein n=1 Tax=Megaviridae environmental sample TaxID=1737588 RepID=A0A5J6VL87_9VIRU|nr:MAG: hypothetical protein [Megaviridae environmental sample]
MSDNESDNDVQQKITSSFKNNVLKWIELDDVIRELRAKTKEITTEKKTYEDSILNFLAEVEEKSVVIPNGKLSRNVSKTKAPLKKETIQSALTEITHDGNKAAAMTEHIINSRPTVERINLKRTRNRKS